VLSPPVVAGLYQSRVARKRTLSFLEPALWPAELSSCGAIRWLFIGFSLEALRQRTILNPTQWIESQLRVGA